VTRIHALLATAILAASTGCLGESLGGGGTGGAGGSSGGVGGDIVGAGGDVPIGTGSGGSSCGAPQTVALMPSAPDVLIMMDRAASMNDAVDGTTCPGGCGANSKWWLLSSAVESLVAQNPQIDWGLAFYGSDDSCDAGQRGYVAAGPGTASAITSALAATTPGGEAPTGGAIMSAVGDLQVPIDGHSKYILLVSDGHSGCGGDDTTQAAAAATCIDIARMQSQMPTLVLGPAPGVDGVAVAALSQWAASGGAVPPGGAAYYTPADVRPGFGVSVLTSGCGLALANLPLGLTDIAVTLTMTDGTLVRVPQDPTNGWSYSGSSATAIVLLGTYCADVMAGTAAVATITYLCSSPTIINVGG
jgi:hypothetical protein